MGMPVRKGSIILRNEMDTAAGIFCALALILIWLITSVEIVTYGIPGYYEREYTKYHVLEDGGIDMTMEDLLQVTDEMMAYLRGNREDLHVMTVIGGESREFFNEREIAHMEDVRDLFLKGLLVRRIMAVLAVVLIAFMAVRRKRDTVYVLARSFQAGTAVMAAAALVLGIIISTDFTKYFTIFHQIFFDNDLWLLNPATDLLINIVPEPFFVDTALYIGLIFAALLIAILAACTVYTVRHGKTGRENRVKIMSGK